MLCIISLLSIVRVKYPIGEINYIPKLKPKAISKFINQNPNAILLFSNNPQDCSFANFAITHYSKTLKFALIPESEGIKYQCKSYPCAIPFVNGKHVQNFRSAPHQQAFFAQWCHEILHLNAITARNVEVLRLILNDVNEFCIIGVDRLKRPSNAPTWMPFYQCRSESFGKLNIQNISKGYYVYRGIDHSLNLVENDNFFDFVKTGITPYYEIDPKSKKYTAGFLFDTTDQTHDDIKINLLLNLSRKFDKDFYFTRFDEEVIYNNKLQFTEKPLLVVLDNSQPQVSSNWILTGKDSLKFDSIADFLEEIKQKKIKHSHRSQSNKFSIQVDEFDKLLLDSPNKDTLLLISDNMTQYIYVKFTVETVLSHLNTDTIDFFSLNATINDLPFSVNPQRLPALIMFQGGKNKKENPPVSFQGAYNFKDLIQFIHQTATSELHLLPYDTLEKDNIINQLTEELVHKYEQ